MNASANDRRHRNFLFRPFFNFLAVLLSRTTVAVLILLVSRLAPAQMIDLNTNGMSDVWEQLYGASNLSPSGDTDGDGFSNLQEALAGTDPFNASSFPKIAGTAKLPAALTVTIPCELGKQYQLQSVTALGSTNWVVETNVVVRSGTTLTLMAAAGSVGKFFRTAVSDVDTDGDGVSDWEEYKLGLDPLNAMSNGQMDSNGQLMTDAAYAMGKFSAQNIFSIAATDPTTVQPDPGASATDLGVLTVSRGGFALKSVTVNLALGGPGSGYAAEGVDHATLPRTVTFPVGVSSQNISVTPLADTNLHTAVIAQMKLIPGTNYTTSYASNASVVIYPSPTANGTGLNGNYYTNANVTYTNAANFNAANLKLSRVDTNVDFTWGTTTSPITNNGYYTVRWTGQVLPQYSETYYFVVNSDEGCKLWVNDQLIIDNWKAQTATDSLGIIALQGGVLYNIKLEYLQITGSAVAHLSWYSPSQPKQIIPSSRLFPTNSVNAPSSITCALSAVAFLGQPFSFTVTGANTPLAYTASGLPPGLGFTNGVISGIPNFAGTYQTMVTSSNTVGLGSAAVSIQVIDTGSSVVREVWTGVTGTNIADIPLSTPATLTNTLGTLEGITNYGSNYGERIRGYLTAPVTGNYYFWIAGSDSAEAWISNDSEPANKLRRANVFPAGGGTTFRNWNSQPNQQSKWISLVAGQKYYVEILHKAGTTPDHWSVGWSQDPIGTNTVPTNIVPGYVLSRYYPQPASILSGTFYSANMLALPGVNSSAVGSATLLVSADGSQAILNYSVSGITGAHIDHIYSDPYLASPTTLVFDIAAAHPRADGSYVWTIKQTGTLAAADIVELLIEGKASIVINSIAFPNGEIGGHFTFANGSQTFTAPPAPPAWTDDHTDTNAAARFLIQSTFGPNLTDIANVQSLGYSNWISAQFALPATHHLPIVMTNMSADPSNPFPSSDWFNAWWQNAVTAPDQLRQRVAFALSEILVISESGVLQDKSTALAAYYDTLIDNAFGNYRDLLKAVTLTPAMGLYLNMQANDMGSLPNGTHPNENYAREINQLFSIGLYHLWPDGTLVLNSQNSLVPTYDQNVINGFASTFTGWNYYQTNQLNGRLPTSFSPSQNLTNPMVLVPLHHELGTKKLLDNVMIPAAVGSQTNSTLTNFDNYCSQNLEAAFDSIFNNPNVGPFVCRQLIQRLVTSNPSRNYLYRVVQKFNDNGSGVRGDMKAVIRAILTDYEARSVDFISSNTTFTNSTTTNTLLSTYGKQREPLLRVTATARAFPAPPSQTGTYVETGTQTNTITLPQPHRMANGDTVALSFTDTSGNPAPPNQNYSVTVINSNTFTVNTPNLLTGTYSQSGSTVTVTISAGHGLVTGNAAYVVFTSGGAASGGYAVTVTSGTAFTVNVLDSVTRSGNCLLSRISASGFTQSSSNITVSCAGPHALTVNETIYIPANSVLIPAGQYVVKTIPDPLHFTFILTNNVGTQSGFTLYPLGAPSLTRSGNATVQWSTWNLGYTDSDPTYNLAQSPLSANTVFNFFFPNYAFPGALSAAGLTTPEFQLTSDTSTALQMNFLEAGILNNTANTNGLSSFNNGGGAIVLDIGPWMTTNFTAAAGVPSLVDNLNTLLLAGQLSAAAKTNIVNYVTNTTNFGYSAPPTATQMRDRVRAVIHLIVCSPDFTIQK